MSRESLFLYDCVISRTYYRLKILNPVVTPFTRKTLTSSKDKREFYYCIHVIKAEWTPPIQGSGGNIRVW